MSSGENMSEEDANLIVNISDSIAHIMYIHMLIYVKYIIYNENLSQSSGSRIRTASRLIVHGAPLQFNAFTIITTENKITSEQILNLSADVR